MGQESFRFSASDARRAASRERASAKLEPTPREEPAPALTVTELTRRIAGHLSALGRVRVEGEVSGLKETSSGHVYFDLADEGARVSCVVWRSQAERALRARPADGAQVLVHGKLDVYGPHGRYKLIVDRVEPLGLGALLAKLEALKAELRAKGWFDRARPLPAFPRRIGIVTSRDGAALRDFLRTRSQRWPLYPVRLCHASVQGPDAAGEIAEAIARLDASGVDVIVVTRGGGSLEDLWSFNERVVAEAIREASVPVVSAVGHESDTCLSDFVADCRAHTPTDAAQRVLPDRRELLVRIERSANRMSEAVDALLLEREERLVRAVRARVLRDPEHHLRERRLVLAETRARLSLAARRLTDGVRERLAEARRGLEREAPARRLLAARSRVAVAASRLVARGGDVLDARERRLALAARSLEATSPLRVLARGYSVTAALEDDAERVVTDAADVRPGDRIATRLARGRLVSRVEDVEPSEGERDADT